MGLRKQYQRKPGISAKALSNQSSQEKMVEGSFWLTASSVLSRLMGALYIIPWVAMMGSPQNGIKANVLFGVGYQIYALFLQIGSAGVPTAISKIVAYYNSIEEYKTSWNIFQKSLYVMLGAGVVCGFVMYIAAPSLAAGSPAVDLDSSIRVIRSLVPAVVIIPAMSLVRGLYQGFNDMKPSAISQLLEQIVRLVYMLLLTFSIMNLMGGHYSSAVVQSTFAAFVGALVSFGYLLYKLWEDREGIRKLLESGKPLRQTSTLSIYSEVLKESIPIVLVGSAIQFATLIDQYTYKQLSVWLLHKSYEWIEIEYGLFSFNVNKIISIVISLAVSIASATLPLLSAAYGAQDQKEIKMIIRKTTGLFSFIMFPAAAGMFVVARPIYNVFYSQNSLGSFLLQVSCVMSIALGAFTVFSIMLQAVHELKASLVGLGISIVVKFLLQPFAIFFFHSAGPLLATTFAFAIATFYMIHVLHQQVAFDLGETLKDLMRIIGMTLVMAVLAGLVYVGICLVVSPVRKIFALVILVLVAGVGGFIYLLLSLKNRMADQMLGSKVGSLRSKLKMK